MNYYLLIPFVIILLLFIPIKLEGRASFNFLDMKGAIGVFLYKFNIEHQRFRFVKGKLVGLGDNDEEKDFDISEKELIFTKMLIGQIKDKTRLQELFVMYNLGTHDAFQTAMIAGVINVSLLSFMGTIKNFKPTASLGVCDNISYNNKVCQFALTIKISISLFDIVYSLLRSLILTRTIKN